MIDTAKTPISDQEQAAYCKLRQLYYPQWAVSADATICDWLEFRFECSGPDDQIGWLHSFLVDVVELDATEEDLVEFLEYRGDAENGHRYIWDDTREITLGALSAWILERCELVTVEPFVICGRPCESGSVYLALERIASRIVPNAPPFGPSTGLLEVLQLEDISKFWDATAVAANKRMPEFRSYQNFIVWSLIGMGILGYCSLVTHSILLVITGTGLFNGEELSHWTQFAVIAAFVATTYLSIRIAAFADSLRKPENVLPRGITTFGDLARHIAQTS